MTIFFLLVISISILMLGKTSKLYDLLCYNTGKIINNDILFVLKNQPKILLERNSLKWFENVYGTKLP